ncbi:hypothetical protein Pcinc_039382 [Petrolisthes cinctipes]|uniref:Uncharacterized protein n=1 Tax=Petrolisthes cinctipes TaxID=88211 RepID=A0AAE1BPY7_PETCI|nr:hypothetical protein Pcinc_039382 [Petrolisthes cinctipes]
MPASQHHETHALQRDTSQDTNNKTGRKRVEVNGHERHGVKDRQKMKVEEEVKKKVKVKENVETKVEVKERVEMMKGRLEVDDREEVKDSEEGKGQ